ncbi:MAG: hypothetical protein IPN34_22150 [Planctomycetes bacterium]|nr:hypothetical protein [Planctomycetota bacterium]
MRALLSPFVTVVTAICMQPCVEAQIVVDPSGGGHYRRLQEAIDAAVDGATILVRGGTYPAAWVSNKSLTIAGDPAFSVFTDSGISPNAQQAAFELRGGGSERFTLIGCTTSGQWGVQYIIGGPGIRSYGYARLHLINCTISAPTVVGGTGGPYLYGVSAIVSGQGSQILVESSTITATHGDTDCRYVHSTSPHWVPDGLPGIDAAGCEVTVISSAVTGGWGNTWCLNWWGFGQPPPLTGPCPCAGIGGHGGAGIIADSVVEVSSGLSGIRGGSGGSVSAYDASIQRSYSFGQQPDGPAWIAASYHQIPSGVSSATRWHLGSTFLVTTPGNAPGILLFGDLARVVEWPFGLSWIDIASGRFFIVPTVGAIQVPVPNDALFLGVTIVAQSLDQSILLRAPMVRVIEP